MNLKQAIEVLRRFTEERGLLVCALDRMSDTPVEVLVAERIGDLNRWIEVFESAEPNVDLDALIVCRGPVLPEAEEEVKP